VSEKKADKQRYWVTYLLKHLDEGATFSPQEIHLTFIPWFVTGADNKQVIDSFSKLFSGEKAFNVSIGKSYEFKNGRKIPVNLVGPSKEILALHKKALELFSSLESRWAVKNPYVDDEFIPHIRRRPGHNLSEGDKLKISSISLVAARRRGDDIRTVLARIDFDG